MNKIVIVTGSPGAGKSSVTGAVQNDKGYTLVNVGDIMEKVAKEKGYVKDRDEMRYMSNEHITELRKLAAKHIAGLPGKIIVDTHATVQQHNRYVPGLPGQFLQDLGNVVGLFYIDADPKDILRRRGADRSRTREEEPLHVLETQRLVNIATLSAYSSQLNIPLYVILNQDGKLEEAKGLLRTHLADAFGENK